MLLFIAFGASTNSGGTPPPYTNSVPITWAMVLNAANPSFNASYTINQYDTINVLVVFQGISIILTFTVTGNMSAGYTYHAYAIY